LAIPALVVFRDGPLAELRGTKRDCAIEGCGEYRVPKNGWDGTGVSVREQEASMENTRRITAVSRKLRFVCLGLVFCLPVLIILWVMDEARKLQDEQALII
jgi:hypothetical protein